jgi:hypothetical protein
MCHAGYGPLGVTAEWTTREDSFFALEHAKILQVSGQMAVPDGNSRNDTTSRDDLTEAQSVPQKERIRCLP